jgi:hypothetical protein
MSARIACRYVGLANGRWMVESYENWIGNAGVEWDTRETSRQQLVVP